MLEQGALGEHQIGAAGHAEIRAAVAHDDAQLPRLARRKAALAVAGQGSAVAARMRERQPPAVAALPLQVIGVEGQVEVVALEHGLDRAIEPVGHDRDTVAEPAAQPCERAEIRVDLDAGDERVHLRLRSRAPGRSGAPCTRASRCGRPSIPPRFAPGRSRKPLEQQVGRIDRSDRSVEIDEHATLHTRT